MLARAAGSSPVTTGIDHSINPEQLGALGFIGVHAVSMESDHCRLVWQARSCMCVENALLGACLVQCCCMCFVCMHYVDTVGSGAEKERSERLSHSVSWTYRCIMLDSSHVGRFHEIARDIQR